MKLTAEQTENLSQARRKAEEGLRLMGDGEYEKAIGRMAIVFAYINGFVGRAADVIVRCVAKEEIMDEETEEMVVTLKHDVLLNQAFCFLKLSKPSRALPKCNQVQPTQALALKTSSKGLYRRAKAHFALHNLAEAERDAEEGRALDPGNVGLEELLRKIRSGEDGEDGENGEADR